MKDYDDHMTLSRHEEDDGLTLAYFSQNQTPASISPLPMFKRKNLVRSESPFTGIKKRHSYSKITHAMTSHPAGKLLSSNAVSIEAMLSSRGEAKSSAVIKAEQIRSNLERQFPSFVMSLVRSHVAGVFWMGLPGLFCKRHLPEKDSTITLEDQSGREYKMKYIACKTGLSAGWRQFSAVHKLVEGDALVFQLVEPTKFKVFIVRSNDLKEKEGMPFFNLEASKKQYDNHANTDNVTSSSTNRKRPNPKSSPPVVQSKKKIHLSRLAYEYCHPTEHDNEEVDDLVVPEGYRGMIQFKEVKNFENFSVQVDGIPIDSELSDAVRSKYYKLCYSQNAFLHDNLILGLNFSLIIGIISETVKIADAIKASNITTSRVAFSKWDKTLQAFQQLGMDVEFLRVRLRRLVSISYESGGTSETIRYLVAQTERCRADDEIRNIEEKLEELKEACNGFGVYIENLKSKADVYITSTRKR